MYLYIYICLCVCVCVVSPLPETYLFGTRPRVQAQKTFFDIRPNSTHVRPQRICLVPLLSSPVPTHAYLSIFHPSLSSAQQGSWKFHQVTMNIKEVHAIHRKKYDKKPLRDAIDVIIKQMMSKWNMHVHICV